MVIIDEAPALTEEVFRAVLDMMNREPNPGPFYDFMSPTEYEWRKARGESMTFCRKTQLIPIR